MSVIVFYWVIFVVKWDVMKFSIGVRSDDMSIGYVGGFFNIFVCDDFVGIILWVF